MKKIALLILSLNIVHFGWALDCKDLMTLSEEKGRQHASLAAINANGAAVVTWIKSNDHNTYSLQASSRESAHAPWTPPQSISQPMNIQVYFPYVTSDGACTVIWFGLQPNNEIQYYYAKKESTSPWVPGQSISYPELTEIKDAIVDFKGDPFVLAAYPQESSIYSYLYKYNEKPHLPFRELSKLPKSDEERTLVPQMLTNQLGKIVALWGNLFTPGYFSSKTKDYHFYVSFYKDSGSWDTRTDIGAIKLQNLAKDKVKDISGSLNKKNKLALIWSHFNADSSKYTLKSLIDEKTEELKDSQEGFTNPSILIDDDGNCVAVWIQTFNKQSVVYAAFRPKEKESWQGEPQQLSNINNKAEHVELGFHNGVFVVVWGEATDSPFKRAICGATLTPKAEKFEWSSPVQLSPANQNCWYPSIAFSEKGGIITWTTHVRRSSDYHIQIANLIAP